MGVSPTFFLLLKFRTTNLFSDHCSLITRHFSSSSSQHSSFQDFSFYHHAPLNDIILNENPVPVRDRLPELAKEIATTIDKALVRNPKDCFPDAGKLLTSIAKSES